MADVGFVSSPISWFKAKTLGFTPDIQVWKLLNHVRFPFPHLGLETENVGHARTLMPSCGSATMHRHRGEANSRASQGETGRVLRYRALGAATVRDCRTACSGSVGAKGDSNIPH
jgi:hypothetical protein